MNGQEQWGRGQRDLMALVHVAKSVDTDRPHNDSGDEIRLGREAHQLSRILLMASPAYALSRTANRWRACAVETKRRSPD